MGHKTIHTIDNKARKVKLRDCVGDPLLSRTMNLSTPTYSNHLEFNCYFKDKIYHVLDW